MLAVFASLLAFTIGSMVGVVFQNITAAVSVGPIIQMSFLMFSGYGVNLNNIPSWFSWLQYISVIYLFIYFIRKFLPFYLAV